MIHDCQIMGKRIEIHNFGPLKEAVVELGQTNLIIGLQSSGKSCVMMMACYCSWVEKRIIIRQSPKEFEDNGVFLKRFVDYYHVKGYDRPETVISYQTGYMSFTYDNKSGEFKHNWGRIRSSYKRPKVSYIPAERNLVSLINNWSGLKTSYYNIIDFKDDWDIARSFMKKEDNILGLGVSYVYDANSGKDSIVTRDKSILDISNTSSGVQSLVPQMVLMDYLCNGIDKDEKVSKERSFSDKVIVQHLLEYLYQKHNHSENVDGAFNELDVVNVEGKDFLFRSKKEASAFKKDVNGLLMTHHAEIFLEEPECNLFPTTQKHLVDWIAEQCKRRNHRPFFCIATHSPYVLTHILHEELDDFHLFITRDVGEGKYGVYEATEKDKQEIFDNGSDAFFNLDVFHD